MARLSIRVQPGASREEVRLEGPTLWIRLVARPVEGKANKRLVEIVSELLGVRRSEVSIHHGHASRDKVLDVAGLDDAALAARLQAAIKP